MSSKYRAPYKEFGELIARRRVQAGILNQLDLATSLGVSQQTISRWESGVSRPRDKQMPSLAALLGSDLDLLLKEVRAVKTTVIVSYDQPFPLDALTPESFERFCYYLLSALHPSAKVHRAGKSGNTQEGVDIEVNSPNGERFTFQCKRVQNFGPQHVLAAVAAHTRKSDRKTILLSRIASPKTRDAVKAQVGWDIWDREDLSQRVRNLTREEQRKLIDIFFPGQRLALLGETESGPWQTSEEFFAPFTSGKGAFTHSWKLVGRTEEIRKLDQALVENEQLIFLIGAGGAGKTRILKDAIDNYELLSPDTLIRFVSPTAEVAPKNLQDLGHRDKLIVVDDAHDRADLQLLFQFASIPLNRTKLLLSFRPYGLDYIKAQASNFALTSARSVKLEPLTLEAATALAMQVLREFGGPVSHAEDIGKLTRDCPLATVIGAQIVAEKGINLELAKNEEAFRATLMGKFREIVAGRIGGKSDAEGIRKLLSIIALIQPFHPDDEALFSITEKIEKIETYESKRLIRILADAGLLFKRGSQFRLSPDMLADQIIEEKCIGQEGCSTGYAEHVFEHANSGQIENLLVNLGKLDWRRANGDPTNSGLLDGLWKRLSAHGSDPAAFLSAVTEVACYQPGRALDLAEKLMREGRSLRELPTLIRYAGYSQKYLSRACEDLWELGRLDAGALNQNPSHAVRILSEMCAPEPHKPLEYNKEVVDFGLSLLDKSSSWTGRHTPFDILRGVLRTEGHTTTSSGLTISLNPFNVNPNAVAPLRRKVINAAIRFLSHDVTKIAVLAARFLHDALRGPIGGVGQESRAMWAQDFVDTLNEVERAIQNNALHSVVLVEIMESISWHANYAGEQTAGIANRIISAIPQSIEFRATRALIDGYGHLLRFSDAADFEKQWNSYNEAIASDLVCGYQDGEELRALLDKYLTAIESAGAGKDGSPYVLYAQLVQRSVSLALATTENALLDCPSMTRKFAGIALSRLFSHDHSTAVEMSRRFLSSGSTELQAAVGQAYSPDVNSEQLGEELALLRQILSTDNEWVLRNAVRAVRNVSQRDMRLGIELLKSTNLGLSRQVAHEFLTLFHGDEPLSVRSLQIEDIDGLLAKLMLLPDLDDFWIETFLSKISDVHPHRTAKFLMDRVDYAVLTKDWRYHPCPYGAEVHVPLQFRKSGEIASLFKQVSQWIEEQPLGNSIFHHWSGKVFETVLQPFDDELLVLLQGWIDRANSNGIRIISKLLQEAAPNFIFEQQDFVVGYLEKCEHFGKQYVKNAIDALYSSATNRSFSGKLGEPFPEDIEIRDRSEAAMKEVRPFSAAHELYASIKLRAEDNIKRAMQERGAFEE